VSTAVYLINRQSSSKLSGKTLGVLFGTPRYDHLRVFGCTCYVLLASCGRTKLTAQYVERVFLGYSPEHKGYRCYDPSTCRIRIPRDVNFSENQPFFYNSLTHSSSFSTKSTSFMCLPPIHAPSSGSSSSTTPLSTTSLPYVLVPITNPSTSTPTSHFASKPPVTKSHIHRPRISPTANSDGEPFVDVCTNNDDSPSVFDDLQIVDGSQFADALPNHKGYHLRNRNTIEPPDRYGFPSAALVITEPSNYHEASSIHEWRLSMQEELDALNRMGTWDLVPLPTRAVPITCKWIFKIKTKSDGSVEQYKARLVARGFQQTQGLDYDETFALVAHMTIVCTMDVKNAFLHGDLHEEVYMHPLPGVNIPSKHGRRLRKALYGLKQTPCAWFQRFVVIIRAAGFHLHLCPNDGSPLQDPSRYRHIVGSLVYITITRLDTAHVHILSQFVSVPTSVHYGHLLRVLKILTGNHISRLIFFSKNAGGLRFRYILRRERQRSKRPKKQQQRTPMEASNTRT
jgi:hypothetical protein